MRQRVVLVSNTNWNILNFRMNLARSLVDHGYEVHAVGTSDRCQGEIREAGVDLTKFRVVAEKPSAPEAVVITLIGRLIREKGIFEFDEASRSVLSKTSRPVRFVVCGDVDSGNRSAVSAATMNEWRSVEGIEFLGHVDDVKSVLERSHLVVLPSYREGTRRALLEAGACELPVIATDVPGCREVVVDRESGLWIAAKDPAALAEAMLELTGNWWLMRKFARAGRARVQSLFDERLVIDATLDVYARMLGTESPAIAA